MNDHQQLKNSLSSTGIYIYPSLISPDWVGRLATAMDKSFLKRKDEWCNNSEKYSSDGVALHIILDDDIFINFVQHLIDLNFFRMLESCFFKSKSIIHSFSALANLPESENFSSAVHRDLRFYSGNFPLMLNCLLMIDDFTEENGGTYVLPSSYRKASRPTDDYFFNNSKQITGKKGDMLIFNSNTWHASAVNRTIEPRRAIPMTISRSFMKQLLDYPRALGYDRAKIFSDDLQQVLGYHSRVPESLSEWHQPESERLYRKFQD
jgi:ectoine hydroxylase-related dioxygenase (phytanoyl-CoA dioxygenase family)